MKVKKNTYDIVTERIIDLLEQGVCPWRRPWNKYGEQPQNYTNKKNYNGINNFLLNAVGYELPYFLTFKQAKTKDACVRKGEKGFPVIYWNWVERMDKETGKIKKIPFLRYYTVFNVAQVDGLKLPERKAVKQIDFNPIERAEQVLNAWLDKPAIKHDSSRACYIPGKDEVHMSNADTFRTCEEYYSTLFHELGHATGAKHRLNRNLEGSFGDKEYALEELNAEMTGAFLCAHSGIDNSVIANQAAYLEGWIKRLKSSAKLVITAAGKAQKASNLILGVQAYVEEEAA